MGIELKKLRQVIVFQNATGEQACARLQRGLAGFLIVDGPANAEIYDGTPMPGSGH